MRKLRKNVHEKYTPLARSFSLSSSRSLFLCLSHSSLAHRHARSDARIKDLAAPFLWLSSRSPMRETKFLETSRRISSKQLSKSRLKDGGELQRITTTRESPCARALFDYYTSAERLILPIARLHREKPCERLIPTCRAIGRSSKRQALAGEYRID